jgi:hypothetical protein
VTQTREYEYPGYFHEIIKIENMDQELKRLNDTYGWNLKSFQENRRQSEKPRYDPDLYVGDKAFRSHKDGLPSYGSFYNATNRRLVETIFADDLKNYKYTYDDFIAAL